jgi:hypothetical protein
MLLRTNVLVVLHVLQVLNVVLWQRKMLCNMLWGIFHVAKSGILIVLHALQYLSAVSQLDRMLVTLLLHLHVLLFYINSVCD